MRNLPSNIAERFDISHDEAERISDTVDTEAEFVSTWENECWWTDANNGRIQHDAN